MKAPVTTITLLSPAVLAFSAYLTTLAPSITLRHWGIDTGELAVSVHRLAIPHPSGYPVYLLLGKLFSLIPVGDIAYRLNLMSAFFAALTVGLVTWAIYLSLASTTMAPRARMGGALVGGAALSFSFTFWSQAVIAEVYALHSFFLALLVLLLLLWRSHWESRHSSRWAALLALALGLGLGNHLTLALAVPGLALFAILAGLNRVPRTRQEIMHAVPSRVVAWATLLFLMGLSPYLLLAYWAQQGTWPSLWDASTPGLLWEHISGGPFQGLLFSFPVTAALSRLSGAIGFALEEFSFVGFALAMAGIWSMGRHDRPLAAYWLTTVGVSLLFAINYPTFDSRVYLLPVFVLLAVALGWGTAEALESAGKLMPPSPSLSSSQPRAGFLLHWGPLVLLLFALPGYIFVTTRPAADLSGERDLYAFAQGALEVLPQDALLLTWGGQETFALWYRQYVEHERTDVMVVDVALWGWFSYQRSLQRHYQDLVPPVGTPEYVQTLLEQHLGKRPVYATATVASQRCELRIAPPTRQYEFRPVPVRVIDANGRCG
ncbi:MAG: DUF2723 domain-containing protein [Chloroflexi bacterium]|nr:DUF2723 domain-containing protein [Chloroflexota bacterium]